MSDTQAMEQFFRQRGFGLPIGWGESPALLLIDYMRAFTDPSLPLGSNLDREMAQSVRVLEAAREAAIPIFFTAVWYEEKDLKDAGIWAKKMAGAMTLRAGSPDVELDPRLGRRPDEPIIVKKYASVFFGTDLVSRLNSRRVDTLILTGCTTSGCVRATAVDAFNLNYKVMVPEECVADRGQVTHKINLFDMHMKYADVVPLAEAKEYLIKVKPWRD